MGLGQTLSSAQSVTAMPNERAVSQPAGVASWPAEKAVAVAVTATIG